MKDKDELVWLVERGNLCAGFGGSGLIWVAFTSPNALRFESAELAGQFIVKNEIEGAKAVEHMFCGSGS